MTSETVTGGAETILVVEDEESLRTLTRICLEANNYLVLDAHGATSALELVQKHRGRIHLLLTDIVMSGMSGPHLANLLLASQPEAKVLYMSGYTQDLIEQHGDLGGTSVLEKPFTMQALLTKIYKALHSGSSAQTVAPGKIAPASETSSHWDRQTNRDENRVSLSRSAR